MVIEHILIVSKTVIAVISILLFALSLCLLIWIILAKESICVLGSRYQGCVWNTVLDLNKEHHIQNLTILEGGICCSICSPITKHFVLWRLTVTTGFCIGQEVRVYRTVS